MPWEQEGTVADMVRVAQACDAAGFLYVAVCHHVAIPPEPAEMMSTQWFDPIATLSYVAASTRRTRLMSNVLVAGYQHPLVAAKAFATLDALSNGRAIVGIGAGHVDGEFDALGVSFKGRGAITDHALVTLTRRAHQRMDQRRRATPASCAAAAPADLDRRLGQARAAARRAPRRRVDPPGDAARPVGRRHRMDPRRARSRAARRGRARDRLPPARARRRRVVGVAERRRVGTRCNGSSTLRTRAWARSECRTCKCG